MITLQRARPDDAQEITAIKTAAYNKEINTYLGRNGGPPGYDKVESELYIIKEFIAYKIMLDDRIIGAFFLIPQGDTAMRFEDFVITPEEQDNGYGTRTLAEVERLYPAVTDWTLSTPVFSVGNQHLYQKAGYREEFRDADEVHYRKRL